MTTLTRPALQLAGFRLSEGLRTPVRLPYIFAQVSDGAIRLDASTTLTADEIVKRLHDAGYLSAKMIGPERWAGVRHMLNGWAIVRGNLKRVEPETFFYKHYDQVTAVFNAWDGVGAPPNSIGKFAQNARDKSWDHSVQR